MNGRSPDWLLFPDYSCLFQNNNDSMFDSVKFGVAVVTPEAFSKFESSSIKYVYSWKYAKEPANDKEEKKVSDDWWRLLIRKFLCRTTFPAIWPGDQFHRWRYGQWPCYDYCLSLYYYRNHGIRLWNYEQQYHHERIQCHRNTACIRLYRAELIRHYMSMPIIVTLIGAVIGNILGYTVLKDVCAGMYYGSYSLPTYTTIWNAEAFLLTTVIPIILMILVNFTILYRKLSLSPLKFLRRDLKKRRQKHTLYLSPKLAFFSRFPHACYFSEYQQLCTVICRNPFLQISF